MNKIDAINQVFALFKLNYHNQFNRAYSSSGELAAVKRLWFESLDFESEVLMRGAKSVISASEFLPTLKTMIKHCETQSGGGFPAPHAAYTEACRATSPKACYKWSHLAVYYAGRETGWLYLHSTKEDRAYNVFKAQYDDICAKVAGGLKLISPSTPRLPGDIGTPTTKEDGKKKIKSLIESLNL